MKGNKHKVPTAGRLHTSAIAIGVGIGVLLSILLTAGVSNLVLNGSLAEKRIEAVVFAIRLVSALVGCFIAGAIAKEKYLQVTGFTALGFLAVLLALGIIFYDGSFRNFFSGLISVLIGGGIAFLILQRPKGKRHSAVKYGR